MSQILGSLPPIQETQIEVPVCIPWKAAGANSVAWIPASHMRDPDEIPGFWPWPGMAPLWLSQAFMVNQQLKDQSVSFCLSNENEYK